MHPLIQGAVAAERRRDLLRRADEGRRSRAARRHRRQPDHPNMPATQLLPPPLPAPQWPAEAAPFPRPGNEVARAGHPARLDLEVDGG